MLQGVFENFLRVLDDWLNTFGERAISWGNALATEKFYRHLDGIEPDYSAAVAEYQFHNLVIADLTLELTRSANLCCDVVRATIDPSFRLTEGRLLILTLGIRERICGPEYRSDERTPNPYPGLQAFLTIRETRDLHFGAGTKPALSVWHA